MKKPHVAIVLINWNGFDDTRDCIQSLQSIQYPSYTIYVVDNGSRDGSSALLQNEFKDQKNMEWMLLEENLGFVGGNNAALKEILRGSVQYALLLNNDTVVSPVFLDELMNWMETDPKSAAVGPTIYYHAQKDIIWSAGGNIDRQKGLTSMEGIGKRDHGQYGQEPRAVDFLTGCALLLNLEAVREIGLLDERFFAYYEETEWCVRATQKGYHLFHIPTSKIWHKITPEAREASPQVHYYMTRNRLLFLQCSNARFSAWVHTLLFEYLRTIVSWTLRPKWKHKKQHRKAMLIAISDYLKNNFGRKDLGAVI